MKLLKSAFVMAAVLLTSTPSFSCEILRILMGEMELATVKNQLPGVPDYETYLIRGLVRDATSGVRTRNRGEFVPSRVGMEIKNGNADVVGVLGEGAVDDWSGSCLKEKITYRVEKAAVVFMNHGELLGRITGKFNRKSFR